MKHICRLVLISLLFVMLLPALPTLAAQSGTITAAALDVRSQPALTAPISFSLPAYSSVTVESKQEDGWFLITYNGQTGYVPGTYIDAADAEDQEPITLLPAEASQLSVRTDVSLQYGSTGSEVVNLQTALKELGYYAGGISGNYLTFTENAVKRFQQNNNIIATGEADTETLTILYSEDALSAYPATPTGECLKFGDSGPAVLLLQQALARMEFFTYECNGYFGQHTTDAVIYFQQVAGIDATGEADCDTQKELYKMTGMLLALNQPAEIVQPTVVNSSSIEPQTTSSYKLLQNGDENNDVLKLQKALKSLYYFNYAATGTYGKITEKAVQEFQEENGLVPTGIADPATQEMLYNGESLVKSPNAPTPTPKPTVKPTAAPTAISSLNITLKQGQTSTDVMFMQKQLAKLGYFNNAATGYYGSITVSAVKNFQSKNGLTVDGVAGPSTLKLLFSGNALSASAASSSGSTSSSGSILLLDWFNGGSTAFPKGATAKVIDVDTGLSFNVVRGGGTNHADCEPASAADTAVMKKIYGSWSWTRRAIIVEVGGKRIAASMNGMPHSVDWISGNNFNGHFCIHFLNSRTHGTNKVDPDHQAMVQKAYKSGM